MFRIRRRAVKIPRTYGEYVAGTKLGRKSHGQRKFLTRWRLSRKQSD